MPYDSGKLSAADKEALLKKLVGRFDTMKAKHQANRDRGALCMRALSPLGPWEPAERARRKLLKRACIHLDQLNQYANMLINEFRQSPVGIEIVPEGGGANDDTANLRSDRLRNLEEKCSAIKRAYLPALEASVQRGYGYFGLITKELSADDWDQTLEWRGFPNPDAVLPDPDSKEIDGSDMEDCFVIDRMPKQTAIDKYGESAGNSAFGTDYLTEKTVWISEDDCQIAEYWYKKWRNRTVYKVHKTDPTTGQVTEAKMFKDELPKGSEETEFEGQNRLVLPNGESYPILDQKKARMATVCQCMTNGKEIWDHMTWPGSWIPIVPMLGKVKYVRDFGSSAVEMVTESYILNAIDAAMMYDYYKTAQVEVVSMTPKTPYFAVKGQLEGEMLTQLLKSMEEPVAVVEYLNMVNGETGLGPPTRQPYEPQINALELGAESARRAIQAALGSYGFTKQDDTNVKSGIAIERLNRQSESGAYHFIDNAKISIQHGGRIANELLDIIEDNKREVGRTKADGKRDVVKINEPYKDDDGKDQLYKYRNSESDRHGVIASVRNAGQSQHEEQHEFFTNLVSSPNPLVSLVALKHAVRFEQLGPAEEPLLKDIDAVIAMQAPPLAKKEGEEQIPPQIQAALAQKEEQIKEMQAALQQLQFEAEAKKADNEGKLAVAQAKSGADAQQSQADNAVELQKTQMQEQMAKYVADLKAETDLIIAAMRKEVDEMKAAQQREQMQQAGEQHRMDVAAGIHSQEREIEARPVETKE